MALADLHDACVTLHDACEAILATPPSGVPSRSYVSPGAPSIEGDTIRDCPDILTVHAATVSTDLTSPTTNVPVSRKKAKYGRKNLIGMVITIARCLPGGVQGNPASGPDLQANAAVTSADVWSLW